MIQDNYSLLLEKLDGFIRKFYVNQLLRGALYAVGAVLGLFILLNVLEYYFYFSSGVRTAMLWGFIALSATALYQWVALPLIHYFRLGQVISHEQAATIIGSHFTDVKDKLLNILQLKQQGSSNAIYAEMIHAAVNQKSDDIKLVPFKAAIDLQKNRQYLRYALPPVLMLLFLLFGAPNVLREGTKRLWNSGMTFEKPAPFYFKLDADTLLAEQFADYPLTVYAEGDALPNEMYIEVGKVQYRMQKIAPDQFQYTFPNVQRSLDFQMLAGGLQSKPYTLNVLRKPNMASFDVKLQYPAYIGRPSETLLNVGDLVVPQGTQITWIFQAQHTDALSVRFGQADADASKRDGRETFVTTRRAMQDETYTVFLQNSQHSGADSIRYAIAVIPDLNPQIRVETFADSTSSKLLFFAGEATDDYGISNLTFNSQVKKAKSGLLPVQTTKLPKQSGKQTDYAYTFDLRSLNLEPGDEVNYYFEVFDNDAVNGAKSARTEVMRYRMSTLDEFRQEQAQASEDIKKDLEKALRESLKIQEELKKLREKVLQQKELDWQSRKQMEKLLDRQKELQQQIEKAQQNFQKQNEQKQDFQQSPPDQQQKQEQLEKLFQETLSEEMKQLMEDIEKLLQEMNKEDMLNQMEEMQMNSEDLGKDLERLQELYKQMEVENLQQQQIDKLEELANKQEELSKETEGESKDQEQLQKEQDALNKAFEQLQKEHKELLEKNEELKRPQKMEDQSDELKDIQKDMKDAKDQLDQKQNKPAGKKQQKAANKMKDAANKMKQHMESGEMEQMQEDIATLRQLLENLVTLSFNQEDNLRQVQKTTINTPKYVELAKDQFKIKDDFRMVEDSLNALAQRNFQLTSTINEKVAEVKSSLRTSITELEERRTPAANEYQQRGMKGMNDLALLLSEMMEQMQQEMSSSMPGKQSCQKPGEGKGQQGKQPKDKMSKGQEDLNKTMEDLKKRLEQGKGKDGMSKEFAQMAARQAALRNALREMQKQKQEQGKGSKALDEIMQEMDKVETDLVNKRLNNEMLKRQQQILNKLLEEERAEREQEQDEKRQAESAQQQAPKMPPAMEEYLKKRRAEVDMFRTVSPSLKPYYKNLVEEYLKANPGR